MNKVPNKLLLNTATLILTLIINAFSESLGHKSIGEVSDTYHTLITPAGYAFAIWGFIYLLLVGFIGFQWYNWLRHSDTDIIDQVGLWFIMVNLINSLWVIVWVNEGIGLSVLIMVLLLFSLFQLAIRLRLEIWDAPVRIIALVWWPICFYFAWIVLATVVNISAFLVSINWEGGPFSESTWSIIMLCVSTLIYIILIFTRNMREAALVGVWGFLAVGVQHLQDDPAITYTTWTASFVLLALSTYHALQNWSTNPFLKIRRGEI